MTVDLTKGFDLENMDETSVKTIKQLNSNFAEALAEFKKGLNVEEALTKMQNTIDEVKTMQKDDARLKAIEDCIIELKATKGGETKANPNEKIEEAFKSYVSTDTKGVKYVDFGSALNNGRKVVVEFDKKDATTIMGNGVSTRVTVDPNIASQPTYRPWLFDVANVRKASSPTIMYVDKSAPEGTPAFVAEGGVKPLISWEYEPKTVNVKKIAVASKFTTEVATDIDGFVADLQNDLASQIRAKSEYDILMGDGSNGSLVGVTQSMPGYSLTSIKVATPNTFDAIVAAATQIKSSSYGAFRPTHVVLNPQDVANMRLTKNANGNYIVPLELESGNPFSITVIESNQRSVGSILMGDFKYLNIAEYVELMLVFGHENDDIRRNLMTVVAETRLATYIKDGEKYAFVNDTIANITTALKGA